MRYATIIDISELPQLYNNVNIRLVYLHLCLKAGYNAYNRDIVYTSIRQLASTLNMTEGTIRHCVAQLEKYNLLVREKNQWRVTTWQQPELVARPKAKKTYAKTAAAQEREETKNREEAKRDQQRKERATILKSGKTPFMQYFDEQREKAKQGDAAALRVVNNHDRVAIYESDQKLYAEMAAALKNGDLVARYWFAGYELREAKFYAAAWEKHQKK